MAPSEFWRMHPDEFWWQVEMRTPEEDRADNWQELYDLLPTGAPNRG